MKENNKILIDQRAVYKELYEKYKGTPMAVSSESLAHKNLRFSKISKLFQDDSNFTIHDVGMGLGSFYQFLIENFDRTKFTYSGTEILEEYVAECEKVYPEIRFYNRDLSEQIPFDEKYDYLIMSGVFHQRRDTTIPEWERFAFQLIENVFGLANKGIAFYDYPLVYK